jgi:hypothetical protein
MRSKHRSDVLQETVGNGRFWPDRPKHSSDVPTETVGNGRFWPDEVQTSLRCATRNCWKWQVPACKGPNIAQM